MVELHKEDELTSDPLVVQFVGVALYVLVTVAVLWPLPAVFSSRLPIGTEQARTVPMFNAWTLWWNADRAAHGGSGYWDAPIFYPQPNTFAFSEPQPITMLVAPIIWLTGSHVLAYNGYLAIGLILNGWMTQHLLRYLGLRLTVAIGGGVTMILLPIVHWQIGVLQLVPVWGILWTWLAIAKISDMNMSMTSASVDRPSQQFWRRGIELGCAFAATFFSSVHHALFLSTLMLAGGLTLGRNLFVSSTWKALAIGGLLAAALAAPVLLHLKDMTRQSNSLRPTETVEQLSLNLRNYAHVYGHTLFDMHGSDDDYWRTSPGWLKLPWAMLGIGYGLFRPERRRWTFFITTVATTAFALSLGTHLSVAGWQPWLLLSNYFPGYAQVRSAFRFAYFVQMAVVLMAAQGVDALWDLACASAHRRRGVARGTVLCVVAAIAATGIAAALDPWPLRLRLGVLPDTEVHRDWIERIRQSPQSGAVLCLPMAGGDTVRDYEITAEWMILGTYHGRPLVNGYSGFFPEQTLDLQIELTNAALTASRLEQLYDMGVEFLVIDRRRYQSKLAAQQQIGGIYVTRLVQSDSGIDLYQCSGPAR